MNPHGTNPHNQGIEGPGYQVVRPNPARPTTAGLPVMGVVFAASGPIDRLGGWGNGLHVMKESDHFGAVSHDGLECFGVLQTAV